MAETRPPRGVRVALNRVIFRGMLFSMGAIAVGLYRIFRDKNVAWGFAKLSARNLARLCGVRVRVTGLQHWPQGPAIVVANHQSHFDIAALLGYLPGNNRFAAKVELFRQPALGLVLRTLGMIPIDRGDSAESIRQLRRVGESGAATIIFPEGTRSRDGHLQPFKKGAFVAAIELGLPIVPVICRGTREVMPKGGFLGIVPGNVDLEVLPPIPVDGRSYDDRDRLTSEIHEIFVAKLEAGEASGAAA